MESRTARFTTRVLSFACVLTLAPTVSAVPLCGSPGDGNGDCRISLDDHADFAACLSGPAVSAAPECLCYDMDNDGDIDLVDGQLMQQQFTGTSLITGCVLPVREEEPGTLRSRKSGGPDRPHVSIPDSTINDSVYLFSGEFHLTAPDLVIRGRGFDFEWVRRYRSKIGPDTEMGNGWDYNYNIRLEPNGANLILHDGDGRRDEYCLNANGTWTHPEFFREIVQVPGGFAMVSHDRATWEFNTFSGLPDDGKITAMSDRYGNTISFTYDPAGRLTAIHDTLHFPGNPRGIFIAYNVDGLIQSVTDFTGRQVTYDYYQDPDIGGDAGDLKSVTTPVVVGTPNGNDFPLGKTTIYTYSEGLPEPRLNHNLLTITDPKGQTFLTNTYAATLNPVDLEFDRVIAQQQGLANEQYQFHYVPLAPTPGNSFSTIKCIVNDRVGNVEECYYDYRNRCAMIQRFSGRANPFSPTTDVQNRPVNPLRATDPLFFETRFEYNDESLLTLVTAPEQDTLEIVYEGDVDFFAPQRKRSDPRKRKGNHGPRGAAQPDITEEYEYDDAINFDTSQVTRWVDGRGNETLHTYDASGNRTRTVHRIPSIVDEYEYNAFGQITLHRHPDNGSGSLREDQYTYYPTAAGPQNGYLESAIVDATGFVLSTTYEYDNVGNVTRVTDARGKDTQHTINQLDQVVRSLSREVVPAVGPRYETLRFYDPNDNVVRIDIENRDASGALQPNTHFTTEYEYDILNYVTRKTEEVDTLNDVVAEFEYDANRNQTLLRMGEATNGNQPNNTVTRIYDERDLLYRHVRAAGDPQESTTQYDYDRNGNITLETQGLQGVAPRDTTFTYDGFNRLTIFGDSFGNQRLHEYDSNHNMVRDLVLGELQDVPGSAGNVRLSETTYAYDALDRLTIRGDKFFDTAQNPLTDGESTTTYDFSDSSHLLQVTDDNSHASGCTYDSANRRSLCTDAKGNSVRYTYDANSNVTALDTTDKSDLGGPDELFTDTFGYDGLDRLTLRGDNLGNTTTRLYDSRDLLEEEDDALSNTTTYEYDGLNRMTRAVYVLTDTGTGAGTVIGNIVNTQIWDDTSRLIEQSDGNGNATTYGHDPLNRPAFINFADGSSESFLFDVHDNKTVHTDANGTQVDYAYDLLNRLTLKNVTAATGVSTDTTFEQYAYDGLDRMVRAEDDDSLVTREYDSLSRVVSEALNGVTTSAEYDGVGNMPKCIYPSGLAIDRTFDDLDRVHDITDTNGFIANFLYVGPDRVQFRSLGNGSDTTYQYDGVTGVPNRPGDLGVQQVASIFHNHPGSGSVIDLREFIWDPEYNKNARVDPINQLAHTYEYDSIYRVTRTVVDDTTPPMPTLVRDTQYQLDNVGNRNLVVNDNCAGPYTLNPGNPPADFQMNQYTTTGCDNRDYDSNGNWVQGASLGPNEMLTYDYKDRLIVHDDLLRGITTTMAYDALDRRIRLDTAAQVPLTQTDYFYHLEDVIEEQDSGGNVTTYVHGDGVDELIQMRRGPSEFYYHCDDLGNVMALTDSNGALVERYEYQDFGEPEFFDGTGTAIPFSLVENPYLFTGRRYDASTGLYFYRARYLDPIAGRFVQRDPLGMWYDESSTGNAYSYAGNNPWTHTDPYGLAIEPRDQIKTYFETGDIPTQAQFGNLIDSFSISKRAARTGRNPQTGKEIKIAAKNVVKFKAGAALSKAVNMAGGGGGSGGGGVGGGSSSGKYSKTSCYKCRKRGHEFCCCHSGHVIIMKIDEGTGSERTIKKICPECRREWGHCVCRHGQGTMLKAANGSGTHCPGCGAMLCRCTDATTRGPGDKKHKHRGHVTILKLQGGAGNHCPGCGAMLCRCTDAMTRGPGDKKHKHRGHVTILKLYGGAGGGHGGMGGGASASALDWVKDTYDGDAWKASDDKCKKCGKKKKDCKGHKHTHRGHVTILK